MTPDDRPLWRVRVLTIFPGMFPGPLGQSLAGQGLKEGIWSLEVEDIRDFTHDRHRTVDDAPFGGGAGMVMRPDVLDEALSARPLVGPLVYPSPRGTPFSQDMAREWSRAPGATFLCGRFEGVDQRVLDVHKAEEVSLGDFVLSGGEIPALAMMDAVIRLLPGVAGNRESLEEESFEEGLLEYPHYTRPQVWEGRSAPEVLLSGHHENIRAWRQSQAERITKERRPDLWERRLARKANMKG